MCWRQHMHRQQQAAHLKVQILAAGVHNLVVVQQLQVSRLQHVVHAQLVGAGQAVEHLDGLQLLLRQLGHLWVALRRLDEAVLIEHGQSALYQLRV